MIDAYKTGTLIKNSRQKLHLSQQELADKLHISRATVSKWETGKGMPDISLLLPLADCLNLSIAELLKENGHPILAQMFTGFQWGCDLVQIVLPLGAAVKAIGKVGFKTFVKASWVATKKTAKESFEAVFRSGFKDGVNKLK